MGKFEDMETFIRIVEAGSISKAAEQMGIAKSAVSRRLVDLEVRMNTQLIKRTTRKSALSDAGNRFYNRACQILADVNELHSTTASPKTALAGGLKIALPYSFGLMHVAPLITRFANMHPGLDIHLDFSDRQIDLVADNVDVAIRIADLQSSTHIARKLTSIELIVCASPQYLAREGTPEIPADLAHHAFLGYNNSVGTMAKFIGPKGEDITVRASPKMSADNGDFLCHAALSGLGITILPRFLAWKEIESGELVTVLNDYKLPSLNAYAIYPQTRYLSRRVRALIDFLVEKFGAPQAWQPR